MSTAFAPQEKLLLHPEALAAFNNYDYTHPPVLVEISPTNDCNAKCPWCFYVSSEYKQHHSKDELNPIIVQELLEELSQIGTKAITWTGGGDPSVYSYINQAISCAHDCGLKQGMFTNAYRPIDEPEKLDWIRITVTEKFLLTKHVKTYAEKTKVGVNFNLCEANAAHLGKMIQQAADLGVKYFQIRPALADTAMEQNPVKFPTDLIESAKALGILQGMELVTTDYKWHDYLKPHGYPICHGHKLCPFIWHDGRVDVCAYHFNSPERYCFGTLTKTEDFYSIWYGAKRRAMLGDGVPVIPACQHCCKNHEINKVLAVIANDIPGPDDRDFI